jgi:hypothetical protein
MSEVERNMRRETRGEKYQRNWSREEYECFHQFQRGRLLNNCFLLMLLDSWLSLMSTNVMGVFGEVSKVVPIWHSSKHGPQGKNI